MVGFEIGAVPFNPDGWGPPDATTGSIALPNQPSNVPFAPFSRSEKLGRIADWSRTLSNRLGPNAKLNPADSAFDFSGDDSFATLAADKDSSFRLVDTAAKSHHHGQNRPKFNPRWRFNPHHQRSQLPQRRDEEVGHASARRRRNALAVTAFTTSTAPAPMRANAASPQCSSLQLISNPSGICSTRSPYPTRRPTHLRRSRILRPIFRPHYSQERPPSREI